MTTFPKLKKNYDLFKSNIFVTKYSALCEDLIDRLDLVRTSYQKIPSIRIHMLGMKSVNFDFVLINIQQKKCVK